MYEDVVAAWTKDYGDDRTLTEVVEGIAGEVAEGRCEGFIEGYGHVSIRGLYIPRPQPGELVSGINIVDEGGCAEIDVTLNEVRA